LEKESKNIFFVEIHDSEGVKRNVLESLKDIVESLQRFEKFKETREDKINQINNLGKIVKEINKLVPRLKNSLPDAKIRVVKTGKPKHHAKKKPEEMGEEAKEEPVTELQKLESELSEIEGKGGKRLSKQSKTSLEQRYTKYSLTIPVQIKPNCDEDFDNDDYTLIARGLDSEDEEEIEIEDLTDSMCEIKVVESKPFSSKKFNFDIQDYDENIEIGKGFNTHVMLDNNNDADVLIKLWSYVYRGPKSYSGDREENMKEFILKANSLHIVELNNMIENAEPGNYKLKVVVNKNNQKTNNELTKDVVINLKSNKNIENEKFNQSNAENLITANKVLMPNYGLVYESTTEKAKNLVPIFLIILSVLINIVLIWKR